MSINNSIQNSIILGDFVGGDQNNYIIRNYNSIFDKPIFLHYLGEKISRLIYLNHSKSSSMLNSTKIIVTLFDKIIVALSDVAQSPQIYNSDFFNRLLCDRTSGNYIVSITGTKSSHNLGDFLAEREEFYSKPGFYNVASENNISNFLCNIQASSMPKRFDTGKILGYNWEKTFELLESRKFNIEDLSNNNIKNLIIANSAYFSSKKLEEIILIPQRLNGFPLVWDSVEYLKLISTKFDQTSIENIEAYLAAEWINCYLNNYGAIIPNGLIGISDCTLGLKNTVNFTSVLQFLIHYKLLDLILSLEFEELIEFKNSLAIYLKKIIDDYVNNIFYLNNPTTIEPKIYKTYSSNQPTHIKIREIVKLLYHERKCI